MRPDRPAPQVSCYPFPLLPNGKEKPDNGEQQNKRERRRTMKITVKGILVGLAMAWIVGAMAPTVALSQNYDPTRNGQLNSQGEMWNGFEYVQLPHNAYHIKGLVFHESHGGQFWGYNGKEWVLLPVRVPGGTSKDDVSGAVSRNDQPITVRDKDGCTWSFDGKKWTCDGKAPHGLLSPSPSKHDKKTRLDIRRKMLSAQPPKNLDLRALIQGSSKRMGNSDPAVLLKHAQQPPDHSTRNAGVSAQTRTVTVFGSTKVAPMTALGPAAARPAHLHFERKR
jgi:hypothetical protein